MGISQARTPWHLWLVCIFGALWNGFGCLDFWKTATRDSQWLASLPTETIDWLDTAPAWALAAWALGVGAGLAGSALLLFHSKLALPVFAVSIAGAALNLVYYMVSDLPPSFLAPASIGITAFIWMIALFLIWYAYLMKGRGVLR